MKQEIDNNMTFKGLIHKILILALVTVSVCSCMTLTMATFAVGSAVYTLATQNTRLQGATTERIEDKAALMETRSGETVCIVYAFSEYWDGMKINAKFRRGGTYEYTDAEGVTRRVPIYVQSKHVSELVETAYGLDVQYREQRQGPVYQI